MYTRRFVEVNDARRRQPGLKGAPSRSAVQRDFSKNVGVGNVTQEGKCGDATEPDGIVGLCVLIYAGSMMMNVVWRAQGEPDVGVKKIGHGWPRLPTPRCPVVWHL